MLAASFDVSLAFRGKPVIEHVSVAVHPSEIVTLIGPNGAGKTTLAKMLLGLVTPSSGKVSAAGRLARWLRAAALRGRLDHSALRAALHVADPVHFEGARARMPRRDRRRPSARCANGGAFTISFLVLKKGMVLVSCFPE